MCMEEFVKGLMGNQERGSAHMLTPCTWSCTHRLELGLQWQVPTASCYSDMMFGWSPRFWSWEVDCRDQNTSRFHKGAFCVDRARFSISNVRISSTYTCMMSTGKHSRFHSWKGDFTQSFAFRSSIHPSIPIDCWDVGSDCFCYRASVCSGGPDSLKVTLPRVVVVCSVMRLCGWLVISSAMDEILGSSNSPWHQWRR